MEHSIEQLVEKQIKIIQYLEKMKVEDIPGDDLSRAIVNLSTNNVFLGQFVAEHDYDVNMMEAVRKNAWTNAYAEARTSEEKTTQKDCEMKADKKVHEMILREIDERRDLMKIKNLRADCKDLVASLQSRLNQLKQERIDASMVPNPK